MSDDIISRAEAASLLSVHVKTLDRWVRSGRISTVRTGASPIKRYRRSVIESLITDVPEERS